MGTLARLKLIQQAAAQNFSKGCCCSVWGEFYEGESCKLLWNFAANHEAAFFQSLPLRPPVDLMEAIHLSTG